MTSTFSDHAQSGPRDVEPSRPEFQAPEHSIRTELRDVLARLQQLAPESHPALPGRHAVMAQPRTRMFDAVEVKESRRRRKGIWSPGAVLAAELLFGLALLVSAAYGPAYYQCSQMKRNGMFYYGETVRGCVRDIVSARYEKVEDFVRRTARDL